jgi:hypothetical protein
MGGLDRAISAASSPMPDLGSSRTLICASDYSGQHKESAFEAYSFLVAGSSSWHRWEADRVAARKRGLKSRRLSFKALNDRAKRRVLAQFLNAADQLGGLLAVILVEKRVGSLFSLSPRFDFSNCPEYRAYGSDVFERLMRSVHFLSVLINGLSQPGQDVFWFSDADAFAANETRIKDVTRLFANVASHYLSHDLGHFRFGTSSICDDGSLAIEDLCAVADLAAGASMELVNRYSNIGVVPNSQLIVPAPPALSSKSAFLGAWLAQNTSLIRVVLLVQHVEGSASVLVKRLTLHKLSGRVFGGHQ